MSVFTEQFLQSLQSYKKDHLLTNNMSSNFFLANMMFPHERGDVVTADNLPKSPPAPNTGGEGEYEQFLADVWVGVALALLVLSCACCMCTCLLYHKFLQWKQHVLDSRRNTSIDSRGDIESLPSYTVASGLPSYEEALRQLNEVKISLADERKLSETPPIAGVHSPDSNTNTWQSNNSVTQPPTLSRISVVELFHIYRNPQQVTVTVDGVDQDSAKT